MMFDISGAKKRAIPPRPSFLHILDEEIKGAYEDMKRTLEREGPFTGRTFWIPVKVHQMLQRHCHESMWARMHDWEIERTPAQRCYYCDGLLEYYRDDEGLTFCTMCIGGWLPERWSYKCKRCGQFVSKP